MPVLAGHDTIAQAQSGTGKTATFSIAVLQQIDVKQNKCQALILAPTRELAQQIQKVARALGDFLNVSSHACVGGTLVRDDIKILRDGVQIVVGTPGRVYVSRTPKATLWSEAWRFGVLCSHFSCRCLLSFSACAGHDQASGAVSCAGEDFRAG